MKKIVPLILLMILSVSLKAQLTLQWAKQAGSTGTDWARSMTVDAAGNVITTGYFSGTVDFDPGVGTFTLASSGTDDIYISKLDAGGNFVWAKQLVGDSYAYSYDIATDASGNILTTGMFYSSVDFNPGAATNSLTATGGYDIFISKLDANGNYVWAKQIGGLFGAQCIAWSIATDAAGNVFTTGQVNGSSVDYDPGAGTYFIGSTLAIDAFVSKLDLNGNFMWATNFTGSYNDIGTCVSVDPSGNVLTTGSFQNTVDFDPGPGTYNLTSASVSIDDIFISKLDNNGNFVWTKRIGDVNSETGVSLTSDALGNIYTTGQFGSLIDFDPGPGTFTLNTGGVLPFNSYLLKLNSAGNFLWARQIGNFTDNETAHSVDVDAANNVYTTGSFGGTVDFDPGAGTYSLSALSGSSYILKLDTVGTFVWARQLNAAFYSSWAFYGKSIAIDATRNVHLAGYFNLPCDFDLSPAAYNLTSAGMEDAFTAKYCQVPDKPAAISGTTITCTGSVCNFSITPVYGATSYSWSLPSGLTGTSITNSISTIAGTGSGTISVTALNACGSSFSRTLSIVIGPSLTLTVNSPSICTSGSVTLLASGAATYTWSTGAYTASITPSPSVTTTYTVTGSANGCADAVKTATVTLGPAVNLTVSANSPTFCVGSIMILTASGASTYTWNTGAGTPAIALTASVTGTYTVSGSNGVCVDTKTVQVTVYAAPVVTVNSGTICAGDTFTINPIGAFTYTFYNGSATVNPLSSNYYVIAGTSFQGCISSPVVSSVIVNARPTISTNDGTVCAGQVFTMNPTGANTYTFSNGSSTVIPAMNSSFTITGTSLQGCLSATPAVSSVTVLTVPVVSINSGSICSGQTFTLTPGGASVYTVTGNNFTISPAFTSTYYVTGTATNNCISTTTAVSIVSVAATPTVSVNSGAICPGQTLTLTPSGAFTYTFSNGSAIVSPLSDASYSVTGTSTAGCISANTAISSVTVFLTPTVSVNSGSICSGQTFTLIPTGASTYTFSNGSATVNPLSNAAYSVTGTSTAGCISTNTAVSTVIVFVTPTVSINSGSICSGQTFTLIPTGASSYTVTGNSYTVSPTITTSYTLAGVSPQGCAAAGIAVGSVTVNALPVITGSTIPSMICTGETATLTAAGAGTYLWQNLYPGSSLVVTPLASTIYSVTGTNPDGCANTFTITQLVDNCTGIQDPGTYKVAFTVFPNPTNGELTIETQENGYLTVINTLGQVVLSEQLKTPKTYLSMAELKNGIYFIRIKINAEQHMVKILKE